MTYGDFTTSLEGGLSTGGLTSRIGVWSSLSAKFEGK